MLVKNFNPISCVHFGNIVCSYLTENGIPVFGIKNEIKYFRITDRLKDVLKDSPSHIKFLARKEVSNFDKNT